MRDVVRRPLGSDEPDHRYRPIASSTEGHRALEHITLHPQLGVLLAQPFQLGPLAIAQRRVIAVASPAGPWRTSCPVRRR